MMKSRQMQAMSDIEDVREKSMCPLVHRMIKAPIFKFVFGLFRNIYYLFERAM